MYTIVFTEDAKKDLKLLRCLCSQRLAITDSKALTSVRIFCFPSEVLNAEG